MKIFLYKYKVSSIGILALTRKTIKDILSFINLGAMINSNFVFCNAAYLLISKTN